MQMVSAYLETAAEPIDNVIAFADGVMNEAVFKVSDISPYINFTWINNTFNPNQWSQYFLTDNVVYYHQSNAVAWYLDSTEKVFKKTVGTYGVSGSQMFIPTQRLYGYSKIKALCKSGSNSPYDYMYCCIFAGAVVNGSMTVSARNNIHSTEYVELTNDISSLPYIDYIVIEGCDGAAWIKQILLEV